MRPLSCLPFLALTVLAPVAAQAQAGSPASVEATVGVIGSDAIGMFDLFVPLLGDSGQLLFADGRATFGGENDVTQGSIGLGYRTRFGGEWVIGINGYVDYLRSDYDHNFAQLGVGVEALGRDLEFRANVYAPVGDVEKSVAALNAAVIEYGRLLFRAGQETAMRGVDAEAGYRLPLFAADDLTQLKAYVRGYWYEGNGFEDVPGVAARVELSRAGLPSLGNGSRFTLVAGVGYDDERRTYGTLLARLRVPLGDTSGQAPHDSLYRRIERSDEIRTHAGATGRAEKAIYVETGQAAGRVVRVGEGDTASSANNALSAAGDGALVLASGEVELNDTLQLGTGQFLLGGGGSVMVRGAVSGGRATFHSFAPAATLTGTDPTRDVIAMGDYSAAAALAVRGGANGIAANGVNGIVLRGLDISQTGNHGISLFDVAGARITDTAIHDLTICPPPGNPECSFTYTEPDSAHFAGISAVGVRDLTLSNVSITNTTFGLFVANDYQSVGWDNETVIQSQGIQVSNLTITNTVRESLMLVGVENAVLRNVAIDNTAQGNPDELDVIVLFGNRNVTFDGLSIKGGVNAIMFAPPVIEDRANSGVRIANAQIDGSGRGVFLNAANDITFENVTISNSNTPYLSAFMFYGSDWFGGPVKDITFTNVTVRNSDTAVTVAGPMDNINGNIALSNVTTACNNWGGALTQNDGSVFSIGGNVVNPPSSCP